MRSFRLQENVVTSRIPVNKRFRSGWPDYVLPYLHRFLSSPLKDLPLLPPISSFPSTLRPRIWDKGTSQGVSGLKPILHWRSTGSDSCYRNSVPLPGTPTRTPVIRILDVPSRSDHVMRRLFNTTRLPPSSVVVCGSPFVFLVPLLPQWYSISNPRRV